MLLGSRVRATEDASSLSSGMAPRGLSCACGRPAAIDIGEAVVSLALTGSSLVALTSGRSSASLPRLLEPVRPRSRSSCSPRLTSSSEVRASSLRRGRRSRPRCAEVSPSKPPSRFGERSRETLLSRLCEDDEATPSSPAKPLTLSVRPRDETGTDCWAARASRTSHSAASRVRRTSCSRRSLTISFAISTAASETRALAMCAKDEGLPLRVSVPGSTSMRASRAVSAESGGGCTADAGGCTARLRASGSCRGGTEASEACEVARR